MHCIGGTFLYLLVSIQELDQYVRVLPGTGFQLQCYMQCYRLTMIFEVVYLRLLVTSYTAMGSEPYLPWSLRQCYFPQVA